MRQAGRYMAAFREYSDKYPFRMRSETPDIAIELSLQPWRAFKPDGVIFFSDILTPLPALGIEFDVIKGKGPQIATPIRSLEQVKQLKPLDDPSSSLPFVHEILSSLRKEVDGQSTLLGFVGTPWTLAAYAMEGKADRDCKQTKVRRSCRWCWRWRCGQSRALALALLLALLLGR
jgi:uroporphyrinogen decarboxylase